MKETNNTQSHYKGSKSIYYYSELLGFNSYQFDIIKRVARCRHKDKQLEDLKKSIDLCRIYEKEVTKEQLNKYKSLVQYYTKFKANVSDLLVIARIFKNDYDLNSFELDILIAIFDYKFNDFETYIANIIMTINSYIKHIKDERNRIK